MIRQPAVAGRFYPADPRILLREVEEYTPVAADPVQAYCVVSPHAGYMYSGHVAGAVFGAVRLPAHFILLGPNHTGAGSALGLSPASEWVTPLGRAVVDAGLKARLLAEIPPLEEDAASHLREHSLEVQLPFLQARVRDLRFAAICVGTTRYDDLTALGDGIARVVRSWPEPVLIVASSDMTHYESAEEAREKDALAIERVGALDPAGLYRVVLQKDISMCGFAPTVAALIAARGLGASSGRLIRYSNSGEVSRDFDRVVGYAGMAVT
jgi:AmmeMemoRadiSam system protein B